MLRQVLAVTRINLASIPQRFWLSLSTVVAVGAHVLPSRKSARPISRMAGSPETMR